MRAYEQNSALHNEAQGLLLIDRLTVEGGGIQHCLHLCRHCVSIGCQRLKCILQPRVCAVIARAATIQGLRRDLQTVQAELADRRIDLLLDARQGVERFTMRLQRRG